MIKQTDGGVCAAKGFSASGIHVGVKTKNKDKKDIALIVSRCQCTAAAVYTKNIVKAAPLLVTKRNLTSGTARAVFVNSGNANACASHGEEYARRMCAAAAEAINSNLAITAADPADMNGRLDIADPVRQDDIIVASTGVIGQVLPIDKIESGVPLLVDKLSSTHEGSAAAADAIMTTDLTRKEAAVEFVADGKTLHIGGIAKGSGMIHPNMGTMLAFITTDCAISKEMLDKALAKAVKLSFNRVSVDGDTSTNDMLTVMANKMGGNTEITAEGRDFDIFCEALNTVCIELAKMIASDGEGATHLITCSVKGAPDEETAEGLAKSIISSTLVKAAMFGADANWGRILCAMGYSGASFSPDAVSVRFISKAGSILVCENGQGLDFDEDMASKILKEHDIEIAVDIHSGAAECICWGCDITYDYIKINGDYRT